MARYILDVNELAGVTIVLTWGSGTPARAATTARSSTTSAASAGYSRPHRGDCHARSSDRDPTHPARSRRRRDDHRGRRARPGVRRPARRRRCRSGHGAQRRGARAPAGVHQGPAARRAARRPAVRWPGRGQGADRSVVRLAGPLYESQLAGGDTWHWAAAVRATGIGPCDRVLNCFSYALHGLPDRRRPWGRHSTAAGVPA